MKGPTKYRPGEYISSLLHYFEIELHFNPQFVTSTTSHPIIKIISSTHPAQILKGTKISFCIYINLIVFLKKLMGDNPFEVLKEDLENEELYLKVNAMHRTRIVAQLMGLDKIKSTLLPHFESLIKKEDDEVLFAMAEELGHVA